MLRMLFLCLMLGFVDILAAKEIERIQDMVPGKQRLVFYTDGTREWQYLILGKWVKGSW